MGAKSTRVAPGEAAPSSIVPSVTGGVVITVGRTEHKTGTALATLLLDQNEELIRCLQDGARSAGSVPPKSLPAMPEAFEQQVNEWAVMSETQAYESELGMRAYNFSVPVLVASHLGQTEKAQELLAEMTSALIEEASCGKISPATHAWLLGRVLAANYHLNQVSDASQCSEELRGVLDGILARRLLVKRDNLEEVIDPVEAWAWAYLLIYGDKESSDLQTWLKASRLVWSAADHAAVDEKISDGDRMWVTTMALLAFAKQCDASCVSSPPDLFAKPAIVETYGDILQLLKFDRKALPASGMSSLDPDVAEAAQLPTPEAMRQIPLNDFRAWAISLAKLASALSPRSEDDGLAEAFREAMESAAPGDLALGAVTWAYALYSDEWRQISLAAEGA
mmetsp:Transcript_11322/g.21332  ORF Transcript_11322/g.21332 Transcript_11322/m.21332 type:complete len:394 (+) Transcript_11322:33-1214(+)